MGQPGPPGRKRLERGFEDSSLGLCAWRESVEGRWLVKGFVWIPIDLGLTDGMRANGKWLVRLNGKWV